MAPVAVMHERLAPPAIERGARRARIARRVTLREGVGRLALVLIWCAAELLVALDRLFAFRSEPLRWP